MIFFNSLKHGHKQVHACALTPANSHFGSIFECLMTPMGGIGEFSRYNMLDRIQAFSMPQACWKTICIFIHNGWVWSLKLQQKCIWHIAAYMQLCICALCLLLYFTANVLLFPFMQIQYICISMSDICSHSWLCIYAADLYPSGSGSAVLDKYIQSQETKAIPTLFSLLALDQ